MTAAALIQAFARAGKRIHITGTQENGVLIALDMEGRLFTIKNGQVLNRVNPAAIAGISTAEQYLNPGGDGLWPAPEGTSHGYHYSAGAWRVPPGLRAARYIITRQDQDSATVTAEIDLVNAKGQGIPTIFSRQLTLSQNQQQLIVNVRETIRYIGPGPLSNDAVLLAPWTLCQFDCDNASSVIFPCASPSAIWDLYDESSKHKRIYEQREEGTICRTLTNGSMRYQIGMDTSVPWIEFQDPSRALRVRRTAAPLPAKTSYIDIRDAAPAMPPSDKGVRYSVYSDTAKFMEIEAVGGCPAIIRPGDEISVEVITTYQTTD